MYDQNLTCVVQHWKTEKYLSSPRITLQRWNARRKNADPQGETFSARLREAGAALLDERWMHEEQQRSYHTYYDPSNLWPDWNVNRSIQSQIKGIIKYDIINGWDRGLWGASLKG